MSANDWLIDLEYLCIRYSELGLMHDVSYLSDIEKWRLYLFLKRYEIDHGTN